MAASLSSTYDVDSRLKIGCAGARVPEKLIMDKEAGNIFVQRNVANLVVKTDMNLLSALQFEVLRLNVNHIIVCGHYECGGMKKAVENNDHVAPLENWLQNIRDVYRLHKDVLDAIEDPVERHRRFVDLHVIEQACDVFKVACVQKRRIETTAEGEIMPKVHAMIFYPKTGDIKRIPFDFEECMDNFSKIYELFS